MFLRDICRGVSLKSRLGNVVTLCTVKNVSNSTVIKVDGGWNEIDFN